MAQPSPGHLLPPPVPPPFPPPPPPAPRHRGLKIAVAITSTLALLSVVAVMVVGVGKLAGTPTAEPLPVAQRAEHDPATVSISDQEIQALLRAQSTALADRDEQAFLRNFGPKARPGQRRMFRNLGKIPFVTASYEIIKSAGRSSDSFGRGVKVAVDVAFVHQIKDVDIRPVAEWYRWTVEKQPGGKPVITAVGGSPAAYGDAKFVYYPMPWDLYDDMYVVRRPHVLITTKAANRAVADRSAAILERAAVDNLAAWRRNGPPGTVTLPGFMIALEPERRVYNKLFRVALQDNPNEAGFAMAMRSFQRAGESGVDFGGARIAMDTRDSRWTGPDWRTGVLDIGRHEIAHAMVDPLLAGSAGGLNSPETWLVEGFANYMAGRGRPDLQRRHVAVLRGWDRFTGHLPDQFSFYAADARDNAAHYALGTLAARYIAATWGEKALMRLVTEAYRKPGEPDRQLREVTGLSKAAFERRWAAEVRKYL